MGTPNNSGTSMMKATKSMGRRRKMKSQKLKANSIIFNNGTSLQGQVKNMQQNLNAISGRKKNSMEGGQNNNNSNNSLATLHNTVDTIANNVQNIKEANSTPSLNLFGGRTQNGGQNNNSLATLHNKLDNIANNVNDIKNANNTPSLNLFGGGELPMANTFLKNKSYGGGIFENIGNFIQGNTTTNKDKNEKIPTNSGIIETNTKVANTSSDSFPDPSTVVNKPVLTNMNKPVLTSVNKPVNMASDMSEDMNSDIGSDMGSDMGTSTGGNESSFVNSLFGGYKPTKRNLKYLKRYKKNKSIGFTMRSSLKAKGLIPRANGTKRVSKKYK